MQQGYISDGAWIKLLPDEKELLKSIRQHFVKADHLYEELNSQKLVDESFEAMGKTFRTRINREVASYGRYSCGKLDGVFLIIQGAIRDFYAANSFFPPKVSDAKEIYQQFQYDKKKLNKSTVQSIESLESTIEWLHSRSPLRFQTEQLDEATEALAKVAEILEVQLRDKDSINRPYSSVEKFVDSVCCSLIWFGGIKPTKAVNEGGTKTPLLRFLEVFYPFEAESALSSIYEKQKRLASDQRIGSSFLSVK